MRGTFLALGLALALAACVGPGPSRRLPGDQPPGYPPPPAPGAAAPAAPERPAAPPGHPFRLGPAATALVAQAHAQAQSGEYGAAGATIERALRIEPDNPLLWVELGRIQLAERNPGQADGMARKALALAAGDPSAQSSAWRLVADAERAEGRNAEAADADRQAAGLGAR